MQVEGVKEAFDKAKRAVRDKKEECVKDIKSRIEELLREVYEALNVQKR